MPSAALASTLLVGIVLLPGLAWLWIAERRIPRTARPGALAVAEASGIGTAATLVTSLLFFVLGSWLEWPFDFGTWLSHPASFRTDLVRNPVGLAAVLVAEPVLAAVGAGSFATWVHRKKPVFAPGSTVLHEVLGGAGAELSTRFVAVTMRDGRVIEGWMGSYSTDPAERFLSLAAPIHVTAADGAASGAASDELIVNLDSVVDIGVLERPDASETDSTESPPEDP